MEIVQVKTADLKPAEYNPRQLTADQHKHLKESIERFGLVDPIIVNKHAGRENVVIGGHQRLKIAQEMGFEEVPVVYVELDPEREKELNVRLNRNLGEWDFDQLANNFDPQFLLDVGFSKQELDFHLEEDAGPVEPDVLNPPTAQRGEVYQLGEHRLMCGDSTDPADVAKLMDGEKARLIFTDPPYGVGYKAGAARGDDSKHDEILNDDLNGPALVEFLVKVFENAKQYLTDDGTFFVWHATQTSRWFFEALESAGFEIHQTLIWVKQSFTLTRSDFQHIFEPCFYGWQKGKKHFCNKLIRNLDDLVLLDFDDFADMLNVWGEARDNRQNYIHPTQKPVRLAERALKKNSELGDIVLDLFGGSGSTLIACQQAGRKARMMELDPKFVDAIIKRWEIFTGQKAVKING